MLQSLVELTMSTRSYFCIFILLTALTPSTATSISHPKISRNLLLSFLQTESSSTKRTRGGTAHPGTFDSLRWFDNAGLEATVPPPTPPAVERSPTEAEAFELGPGPATTDDG